MKLDEYLDQYEVEIEPPVPPTKLPPPPRKKWSIWLEDKLITVVVWIFHGLCIIAVVGAILAWLGNP